MTFKDFLTELNDMEADMTPAEFARYKKQKEMNPKRAAQQQSKKQDLEAKAAQADDSLNQDEKQAEKLEALAAKRRLMAIQKDNN